MEGVFSTLCSLDVAASLPRVRHAIRLTLLQEVFDDVLRRVCSLDARLSVPGMTNITWFGSRLP